MSEAWKRNLPVPFFSQRENQYRWQRIARQNEEKEDGTGKYSGGETIGDPIPLASSSCNITSICMILHYYGIATDTPDEMMTEMYSRYTNFSSAPDTLTTGTGYLGVGANLGQFVTDKYGIPSNYINTTALTLTQIKTEIGNGYPVWFSFGPTVTKENSKKSGHIAVIRGFTEQGDVIINDPWGDVSSPQKQEKHYA